jgi:hypothetical protein
MDWKRPVAAVLVASSLLVGSVGVAPKAKADASGTTATLAAITWRDELQIIVAGWVLGKIMDGLVLQLRWSRWLYGTTCGTIMLMARSGVRGAIENPAYGDVHAPDDLVNRAADDIIAKVGC